MSTRSLAPRLRRLARDLGRLGLVGALLLALALPARGVLLEAARREEAALKAETTQLRARRIAAARAPDAPPAAAQLERFRAAFPPAATLQEATARLAALAREHRVVLASGEYRLTEDRALGVWRYEARYPVKGAWRDVFAATAAWLNAMPALSLDEVQFKRESPGAREVEARFSVSLYFAADGLAPVPGAAARRTAAVAGAGDG
jgi:hypothetical protein